MFAYEFMRHAFLASLLISLLAGIVGWLLLIRQEAFVTHALPHIGFAGGAVALCFGFSPLLGILAGCLAAAWILGWFRWSAFATSRLRSENQDQITGLVLAAGLAVGLGGLHYGRQGNSRALGLLFGDLLGLDTDTIYILAGVCVFTLGVLCFIGRPLLFMSLSPEQARAKGVPVRLISMAFLSLAGLVCGICSEVAGTLLAFSLMIGPASGAICLGLSPAKGLAFSALSALALCWGSLYLSWETDWPVSFWIGLGAGLIYVACWVFKRVKSR